ncbi:hypothetical protein [Oceanibaculum indicum]|uniref:Uncharacterized protein n=1 Tax=Oceanibaculum indicum TaxID=526216 RepID=A0A420WQG3_9PROT|nr:hypothetical protein [Oceanibaculum indicum]RKQ73106.1 hypothetical protein BCL74_0879 [Oceanibaculum indicum]
MSISTIGKGAAGVVKQSQSAFDALGWLNAGSSLLGGMGGLPGLTGGDATSSATSQSSGTNTQSSPFTVGEGNTSNNTPTITAPGPTQTTGPTGGYPLPGMGGGSAEILNMLVPLALVGGLIWIGVRATR